MAVLWAGGGFGVVLHGEYGLSFELYTFVRAVKQACMCDFYCVGEAVLNDFKAMVLAGDFNFARD